MIGSWEVRIGDCRELLRQMPDESVHCCVTSPPYFGLRDYGNEGQIGLETTPAEYVAELVAVFREVRRVLRDDGTLWLNLGDSYANDGKWGGSSGGKHVSALHGDSGIGRGKRSTGLKPKDLIGIPWRVAFALQEPYYTGKIAAECDRVWLAAMVDAEGSICGTEYETGDRTKTNIYLSVTNTSALIIGRCERLFPQAVKHVYEKSGPSSRICYRWDVERMETKALFIREIYPYLVAKRKQAIVAYTFLELQRGLSSKKKGYLPEQQERRSWLMATLSRLNAGEDVDLPEWLVEPPSLFEPGFYLRQDIIWHKPNPMPESVTDRCTKAHEYIFLLSKSARYRYDCAATAEQSTNRSSGNTEIDSYCAADPIMGRTRENLHRVPARPTRNRRSVWTVATRPFAGAHFAAFPPDLVEPCILAGCPVGGTVLDPFGGSGTTAGVAVSHGRNAILLELSEEYAALMPSRVESIMRGRTIRPANLAAAMPLFDQIQSEPEPTPNAATAARSDSALEAGSRRHGAFGCKGARAPGEASAEGRVGGEVAPSSASDCRGEVVEFKRASRPLRHVIRSTASHIPDPYSGDAA